MEKETERFATCSGDALEVALRNREQSWAKGPRGVLMHKYRVRALSCHSAGRASRVEDAG